RGCGFPCGDGAELPALLGHPRAAEQRPVQESRRRDENRPRRLDVWIGATEVPIMTRGIVVAGALAWALAVTGIPGGAQVPDHLKCQEVKDPSGKREFIADVGGLALEPGCVVKLPAKLLCEQATTANEQPPNDATFAPAPAGQFLCYKAKCPRRPAGRASSAIGSAITRWRRRRRSSCAHPAWTPRPAAASTVRTSTSRAAPTTAAGASWAHSPRRTCSASMRRRAPGPARRTTSAVRSARAASISRSAARSTRDTTF